MKTPHTTHFIANRALQTAYHDVGEGNPFIFIHGFTGSKLDFHDQLAWFSSRRRVIAYDQRGHGESTNVLPYTFDALVDDFIGFIDALSLPTVDLLGHSMGGMVAMRVAAVFPERVRSLVLMDTASEPLEISDANTRKRLADQARKQGCESLVPMMRSAPVSQPAQRGMDYLGETEHWRRISVKLSQLDPEAFASFSEALSAYPAFTDRLGDISAPTSVIVGEKDLAFVKPSRVLAAKIPQAELTLIPDAAHSPQYENADAWAFAVHKHLDQFK